MKQLLLAATALVLTAGATAAAPRHHQWRGQDFGRVSPYERAAIADARAHLAGVRARAWRDGRVTFFERYQIRLAEQRLTRVIRRARG